MGADKQAKPDDQDGSTRAAGGQDSGEAKDNKKDDGENKPSPLKNPKVKWTIIVVAVLLVVAGAFWFYHYWTRGRYEQATNDAYVQADIVLISSKIPGYVERVLVEDNETVHAGQPLAIIDPRDSRAKLEQAQAQADQGRASIVENEAQIRRQTAMIAQSRAQLGGSNSSVFYAQRQADRYAPLTAQGAQTAEQLDRMLQSRDQAAAQSLSDAASLLSAERQIPVLRAQIGSARAQIAQAEAQVRQAQADVAATVLRSSIDGRVGDRQVRVGQYVQTGTRMMSVVPVSRVYVTANFKETQVGLMRVGQPATITVDAVPGDELHGQVQSFSPGTGSQFAILPPQNATGNFTKVVQRVPVKIAIDAGPEARRVLVPGLSVNVTVDTIAAADDRKRFKDEAKRTEHRREHEDAAAIQQGHRAEQPGAGR